MCVLSAMPCDSCLLLHGVHSYHMALPTAEMWADDTYTCHKPWQLSTTGSHQLQVVFVNPQSLPTLQLLG